MGRGLSPSTEATDRREKLLAYQKLPSLQAYLLVSGDEKRVEGYYRQPEGWQYVLVEGEGDGGFPCLEVTLSLTDLYQKLS